MRLHGWFCLPTYARSQADQQYFFLNGRPLRDKLRRERGAARVSRRAVPRPPSGLRAVPRDGSGARRRERAPAEARGALPRARAWSTISCSARSSARSPRRGPTQSAADCDSGRSRRLVAAGQRASDWPRDVGARARTRRSARRLSADSPTAAAAATSRADTPALRRCARSQPEPPPPAPSIRSATPSRSCTASTSWRRRRAASCSSTCTPRTSARTYERLKAVDARRPLAGAAAAGADRGQRVASPTRTRPKRTPALFASLGLEVDRGGPAQLLVRSMPALLPRHRSGHAAADMLADLREQGSGGDDAGASTARSARWPATRRCARTAG